MTRKNIQYSEAFRRQVVAEYEAGSRLADLRRKYGISGAATLQRWIKKYAKEGLRNGLVRIQTAEEAKQVKKLEAQIKELEQALARVTLEKLKLESIVEELAADEQAEEVKKNAAPSLGGTTKKLRGMRGLLE
jgi:transposase-like protein